MTSGEGGEKKEGKRRSGKGGGERKGDGSGGEREGVRGSELSRCETAKKVVTGIFFSHHMSMSMSMSMSFI